MRQRLGVGCQQTRVSSAARLLSSSRPLVLSSSRPLVLSSSRPLVLLSSLCALLLLGVASVRLSVWADGRGSRAQKERENVIEAETANFCAGTLLVKPAKSNTQSVLVHGARPVHLIITMI